MLDVSSVGKSLAPSLVLLVIWEDCKGGRKRFHILASQQGRVDVLGEVFHSQKH